jgi:hypothetical protein
MRKLIFILLLLPFLAQAQESDNLEAPASVTQTRGPSPRLSYTAVGLSLMQWNEPLRLEQSGGSTSDVANFNGTAITIERSTYFYRWGYSFSGMFASGRANGGGTASLITYSETKMPWTMFGIMPRMYYRYTGRLNFGLTVPVVYKNISWPESDTGVVADSGKKLNIFALGDMTLRLTGKLDLYQGIGPIGNGTFWQIGLAYRL